MSKKVQQVLSKLFNEHNLGVIVSGSRSYEIKEQVTGELVVVKNDIGQLGAMNIALTDKEVAAEFALELLLQVRELKMVFE